MKQSHSTRRRVLGSTILAMAALPFASLARAFPNRTANYTYEVQRTDEEWRAMLTEDQYAILRGGGTEYAKSSDLWDDYREGRFKCGGCDAHVYSSKWRAELDKGWVFFKHAEPTAVLMDVDDSANYSGMEGAKTTLIEAHCRTCGSHLGHILTVNGQLVHCINGLALKFEPEAA